MLNPETPRRAPSIWHVYGFPKLDRVNGVLAAILGLASAQARLGARVEILTIASAGALDDLDPDELGGASLDTTADSVAFVRRIRRRLALGTSPDVLHFHEVRRPPHIAVMAMARTRGIPCVLSPHAGLARPNLRRYLLPKTAYNAVVDRPLLRGVDGFSCLSPVERRDVVRFLRGYTGPLAVLPNTLPTAWLELPQWRVPETIRPGVVALTRFDVHQKGLDRLARIAAELPEADVVVYGSAGHIQPGQLQELRGELPPTMTLRDAVFGADKRTALEHATMFVQPSRWEGLSVALMEALACGVPCAVSEYVAATLPFAELDLGLVLDDDPTTAAGQIRAALADREQLLRWSGNAQRYARHAFDSDRVARGSLRFYEQVAGLRSDSRDGRPGARPRVAATSLTPEVLEDV